MAPVALVTGASAGIGRELARLLAADGYELVLVARAEERLRATAEELQAAYGVTAHPLALDLAAAEAPEAVSAWLGERRMTVEILVNDAGVGVHGPFRSTDWEAEQQLLQLNCVALTALTKLVVPAMIERRVGRILNVAAADACAPRPLWAVYGASKAYVLSFSEALAEEISVIGITVTALCPLRTATGFEARAGRKPSRLDAQPPLDPRAVAEEGYRGLLEGRRLVTPGQREPLVAGALGKLRRRRMAALRRRVMQEPAATRPPAPR
jgi:uncharacterized protein